MPKQENSKVNFFTDDVKVNIKNRVKLKEFIEELFRKEKRKLESVNYIFCSDKTLLKINRKYLNHNYYTDIITFDLSGKKGGINAEIFISPERVKKNASKFETSFKSEIHRVIFHGALHLCGYNDRNKADIMIMRFKENTYLREYGISVPQNTVSA